MEKWVIEKNPGHTLYYVLVDPNGKKFPFEQLNDLINFVKSNNINLYDERLPSLVDFVTMVEDGLRLVGNSSFICTVAVAVLTEFIEPDIPIMDILSRINFKFFYKDFGDWVLQKGKELDPNYTEGKPWKFDNGMLVPVGYKLAALKEFKESLLGTKT